MLQFPSKILHADDEPDFQNIVRQALSEYDELELKVCNHGRELLLCAGRFQPDLILLDLKMPVANGVDTIETLYNEAETQIPVILITGVTKIKMLDMYERMGVIGVIHKPVSVGMLPEKIRYFWNIYQNSMEDEETIPSA